MRLRGAARVLGIIGTALLGSAALLVAAEGGYRLRNAARSHPTAEVRFYRHARLRHALVRDVDYGGGLHVNRLGFRGADFDSVKAAGVTRIMTVGASTTFDTCIRRDDQTWSVRLGHWLAQLAPERRFEVINAGLPGFPMSEQVIRLHTELYAYAPDVIVVYAGHGIVTPADVHARGGGRTNTPDAARIISPWTYWLREHSKLYARAFPEARGAAPALVPAAAQWQEAVRNAGTDFERELTSFALLARSFGARVVLVEINRVTGSRPPQSFTAEEQAAWEGLFGTPASVVHAGYERFHEVWQSVAENTDAAFVSTDELNIIGPEHYCGGDPIHFNTTGAEVMARRLAEQLAGDELLP